MYEFFCDDCIFLYCLFLLVKILIFVIILVVIAIFILFFSLVLLVLELFSFVLLQHFCLCVLTFHSSEIMAWLYLLYTNISYNGRISHKWCKYLCTGVLCKWVFYPLFIHLFIFICLFHCIFPRACNGSFWYLEDNQHHPVCLLDFMQFSQVLKVRMLRCLS